MVICNQCGTANNQGSQYCLKDGYPLQNFEENATIQNSNDSFCGQCGQENKSIANYCSRCGHSLEKIVEFEATDLRNNQGFDYSIFYRVLQNKSYLKTVIIGALLAIILVFCGSYILSKVSEDNHLDVMDVVAPFSPSYLYDDFFDQAQLYTDIDEEEMNPLNTINFMMTSNLVQQNLFLQAEGYEEDGTKLNLDMGKVFYLIIPVLALYLSGVFVKYRHSELTQGDKLSISLSIGVLYGLILATLSHFAGFSAQIEDFDVRITASYNFSMISAFLNGLILGFAFSLLGIYKRKEQESTLQFVTPMRSGIASFIQIFMITAVLFSITFYIFLTKGAETSSIIETPIGIRDLLFLLQMSLFALNLAIFNSFNITTNGEGVLRESYSFSLFGESGEIVNFESLIPYLGEYNLYLILLTILTAVFFILVGRKLSRGVIVSNIAIFSSSFAVIFTFISVKTSLVFTGNVYGEEGNLLIGVSMLSTFICSLLFSGAFSYIGARFFGKH